jgi:protein arginine kinase
MAHLPGLTELDQMSHVQKRLNTMGYALRGNLGEHSSPEGNLYQISNQVTLGMSESDLLQDLTHLVNQIIDLERRAREQIKQKAGLSLADRVYRSLGTLQQARLLSGKEAMRCLSDVALGEETGIFKKNPDNQVKRALSLTGAASVQQRAGCELSPAQRDEERATAMREIFSRYEPE